MGIKELFMEPVRAFSWRYLPILLVYFAYGFGTFSAIAQNFWVKSSLPLSAKELVELGVWANIPWIVKMFFGQIIDSVALFGSNRKSYIHLGALLVIVSILMMVDLVGEYHYIGFLSVKEEFLLSALIGAVGLVIQDIVADTLSAEVVSKELSESHRQAELARIQVLIRISQALAFFIAGYLGGKAAQYLSYETVFLITLAAPLLSMVVIGFIDVENRPTTAIDWPIFGGSILFGVFTIVMGQSDFALKQELVFGVSLGVILWWLGRIMAPLTQSQKARIYAAMIVIFLYRAMPSVGPAMSWWQIDVLGFDESFFATLSAIGGFISLAGVWLGSRYIIGFSIVKVLKAMVVISLLLSLPILAMVYGWHERLGIDPHTVALVDTALASPFDYVAVVVMFTIVALYAPNRHRATWFALMASFMNLALMAGGLLSKMLNGLFVVKREMTKATEVVSAADYSELGPLFIWVLVIGFVVPMAALTIWGGRMEKER